MQAGTRGAAWHLAALAITALLACDDSRPVPPIGGGDPDYARLFPFHVEICANSQYRPRHAEHGGSAGHGVLYLSDTCLDPAAEYPQIRHCEGGDGVGVNMMFRNVNWVAVPGRRFFFHGLAGEGEPLTPSVVDATVAEAIRLGIFRGVRIQERILEERPPGVDEAEFVARAALATDYALAFARTSFCAKLPVTQPMLEASVEYLNQLNRQYGSGQADYEWSGYHDNCTHTIRNSLAAADVWSPIGVNLLKVQQIFHLAVPANEFVKLAVLANDGPADSPYEIHADRVKRRALERYGWLPTRHGALIETVPVHEPNEVYDPTFRFFVLEAPLLRWRTWQVDRMLSDPRYSDLGSNPRHFRRVYSEILARRRALEAAPHAAHGATVERYLAWVELQLAEVDAILAERDGSRPLSATDSRGGSGASTR